MKVVSSKGHKLAMSHYMQLEMKNLVLSVS